MGLDYKKLGLKVGLEIHQQLDTHKLFCDCPSEIRKDKPDIIVKRELRPLAGETGVIDKAALYEKRKKKFYIYEAYSNTTCLVELDEEPPHLVNEEALELSLILSKMLNCEIPGYVQFMRKTVVDGSNTSGFQRTALIGIDGYIETKEGKIGITNVCLEEDAGRRVAEDQESVTYRLDRLGIPLIEIGTAPDIKSPEQAKEVAQYIGNLLRSTGKVIRGIGTIRQDLNVSIAKGARIEIKGVQDLRSIPELVEKEVERQLELVNQNKKVDNEVRNAKPDNTTKFLRPMPGAARMYPETDIPLIHINKERLTNLKLPETHEEKLDKFKELGLSDNLAKQLATHKKIALFEELVSKYKVNPSIIADAVLSIDSRVRKEIGKYVEFPKETYYEIFELLDKNDIVKESLFDIFVGVAKGEKIQNLVNKFKTMSDKDLEKEIDRLLKENKDAPENKIKGIIIGQLRGKAEPKKIIEILNKK